MEASAVQKVLPESFFCTIGMRLHQRSELHQRFASTHQRFASPHQRFASPHQRFATAALRFAATALHGGRPSAGVKDLGQRAR
jgi:hypothetical protein